MRSVSTQWWFWRRLPSATAAAAPRACGGCSPRWARGGAARGLRLSGGGCPQQPPRQPFERAAAVRRAGRAAAPHAGCVCSGGGCPQQPPRQPFERAAAVRRAGRAAAPHAGCVCSGGGCPQQPPRQPFERAAAIRRAGRAAAPHAGCVCLAAVALSNRRGSPSSVRRLFAARAQRRRRMSHDSTACRYHRPMLKHAPIVPYLPVADVARARAFYEQKVGPCRVKRSMAASCTTRRRFMGVPVSSAAPARRRRVRRSGRSRTSRPKSPSTRRRASSSRRTTCPG